MTQKLMKLLDYQRFSPNERITAMIEETDRRVAPLSDDDLMMVAAAGEATAAPADESTEDGTPAAPMNPNRRAR